MSGSGIDAAALAGAEMLAAVAFTDDERALALLDIDVQLARYAALRGYTLANDLAPAAVFDPRLPGRAYPRESGHSTFSEPASPLPAHDEDIAFAPLPLLAGWLRRREISSDRLTRLYLDRLGRYGPGLECVVTLTPERALAEAARADREIAQGRYRGPLHGVPWGAKDLLDTAGIATTWGATPYRERIAERDAGVVRRLEAAGAVLVAKLTLGALAYGDVWFGGRTRNPWNPGEGSSGSSAGSASAVAAGLVGFAIGSETLGSIVSPCMRCGATGLRPTFGRVSRSGAMALAWSLDKVGPIVRRVEDAAMVLAALNGHDPDDPGSFDWPFRFDAYADVAGARLGYDPRWLDCEVAEPTDRGALDAASRAGFELVEIAFPALPYEALWSVLHVEAAAAFDELTRSGLDDSLVRQDRDAWPNLFRRARLVPAVEYVQAGRLRRRVMEALDETLAGIDALIGPSFAGPVQLATNMSGHPSLTLRSGFLEKTTRAALTALGAHPPAGVGGPTHRVPHGITLWGRLLDEARLLRFGMALEEELAVWDERPPLG